jgi:hypothetical protein
MKTEMIILGLVTVGLYLFMNRPRPQSLLEMEKEMLAHRSSIEMTLNRLLKVKGHG